VNTTHMHQITHDRFFKAKTRNISSATKVTHKTTFNSMSRFYSNPDDCQDYEVSFKLL